MGAKFLLAAIVLCTTMAVACGWEFSKDEEDAIRSGTLRYSIDKPGCLALDMCSGCEGEFDRLEVFALKDAKGQPVLPYRIRVFKDGGVSETSVIPNKDLSWTQPAVILFVDQNPFPSLADLGGAGDEGKAIFDGMVKVEEKDGRRNVTLVSLRPYDSFIELRAGAEGCQDRIQDVGIRTVPQWPMFDDGLILRNRHTELMRSGARFFKFLSPQKYICSWAMYEVDEPKSGWIGSSTVKEHPFVLRVRIWKAEEERLTRANALCIARVSGCVKLGGSDLVKIDCEKGEKEFSVKILAGALGESSRTLRLRYRNAESSEYISPDMSFEELMKQTEKFKEKCSKSMDAKRCRTVK